MATVYNLDEAETNLAKLLDQVEAGEDVAITRGAGRFRIVSESETPAEKRRRGYGALKGKIKLDDSFFDPLPEEELRLWEGR